MLKILCGNTFAQEIANKIEHTINFLNEERFQIPLLFFLILTDKPDLYMF
jgi:5,10-methylene-tetrahydrofolate dehydrogenase/methenyl tetrahydrofolate cyclohydrolase